MVVTDERVLRFGRGVRRRRLALGLTQRQVAQLAWNHHDNSALICNIEAGKHPQLPLLKAARLAEVLGTTVDALLAEA